MQGIAPTCVDDALEKIINGAKLGYQRMFNNAIED